MDHLIKFIPGDVIINKTSRVMYLVYETMLVNNNIQYKIANFVLENRSPSYSFSKDDELKEIFNKDTDDYERIGPSLLSYDRWDDWLCHDHKCPICEFIGCSECVWSTKKPFPILPGDLVWIPKYKRTKKVCTIFLYVPDDFNDILYDLFYNYPSSLQSIESEFDIGIIIDNGDVIDMKEINRKGREYYLLPESKHLDGICDMCVINNCENCKINEIRAKYRITRKSTGTKEDRF